MQRVYQYRGYEITVEADSLPDAIVGGAVLVRTGYLAIVSVRHEMSSRAFPAWNLSDDNDRPFDSASTALMAGFTAGQRFVDDVFAGRQGRDQVDGLDA
ncbi:hypothetical protein [Paraburkholderia kururiensis]|uniref:hypothetical protein n=1 Tax=Paraburkholderia kururiensis TaxID=984307 RepID=UPI0005A6C228|nr:hypothetical protein [Paraburkholderia kururiensis]